MSERVSGKAVLDAPPKIVVDAAQEDGPRSPAVLDRSSPERSIPRVSLPPPGNVISPQSLSAQATSASFLTSNHLHGEALEQPRLAASKSGEQGTAISLGDVSTSCGGEPSVVDKRSSVQDLVRDFVRRATLGVPCELIDLSNGRRRNAVYSLDSALTTFEVQDGPGDDKLTSWPLENLHDVIYASQHPVVNTRRWASLAALGSPELDRAAMIESVLDGGNRMLLMLLEENVRRRDHFVAAMRVLKLYAQTTTPQTTARSQRDPGSPGLANGSSQF